MEDFILIYTAMDLSQSRMSNAFVKAVTAAGHFAAFLLLLVLKI